MMFATIVYVLCAATSLTCALLLQRAYARTGARLLFWSAMCFWGFFVSNLLLFVPVSRVDWILVARQLPALLGIGCLLYGMLWENEQP
jgi:hypothetical protein